MIAEPYASDPVFMDRHYAAMRQVRMASQMCRTLMRTFAPRNAADDARDAIGARYCPTCTPPPEVFTCPQCDWETDARWRFGVHLSTRPKWCIERGQKKAKQWASKA